MATQKRKAAPIIEAIDPFFDHRAELLKKLNEDNPDYTHMYQKHDVAQYELDMKRQEVVMKESGEPETHAGDPVVRILKEQHAVNREASTERSALVAGSVKGNKTTRLKAKSKTPIKE